MDQLGIHFRIAATVFVGSFVGASAGVLLFSMWYAPWYQDKAHVMSRIRDLEARVSILEVKK